MIRLLVATLLLAAIAVTVRLKARGVGATRSIKISARAAGNRGAASAITQAGGRRPPTGAAGTDTGEGGRGGEKPKPRSQANLGITRTRVDKRGSGKK